MLPVRRHEERPANDVSAPAGHPQAFARYHARLGPFLQSEQAAARRLGVAFAPRTPLQLLLRNTVMRVMGLPKVTDLVMGRSFHDAIELPAVPSA